uniref:Putative salivary secreted peptide n=1 Tax=Aedes albopictus TaxID=7160 RepID=Q5MIS9_AEDAL|nr:putative salivary secreted peptide [Aedes albopictus]
MGTATTISVVIGCNLLLIIALIIGHIGQCQGAPVEADSGGVRSYHDDIRIVRLIHYLSYLIDHLVRTYITDWALTSPKEASDYFEAALVAGKQDEPKVDGGKASPYQPDPAKAERSVQVVESISKSKK